MKKRIITLLAILALLVTCAVFAVQAEGEGEYTSAIDWTATCPCGCGDTLADVAWTTWTKGMTWDADGHYLVTGATFTETPGWGASNLTILLRSTADPDVNPEPVTMSMNAKAQFNVSTYVKAKVSIIGEEATIESQLADTNGGMFRTATGGVLTIKGDVTLKGAEGNTGAGNNGGLIAAYQGTVNLEGVTLYQVTAVSGGGCLYTHTATINATDCAFIGVDGVSAPSGGAFRVGSSGKIILNNCTVDNTKASTGGLAYVVTGLLQMQNCTVNGCDATTGADNIYMKSGTVYLQNTIINTGDNGIRGNGAYVDGGILRLHQATSIVGPEGANKLRGNIAVDTSKTGKVQVSTSWTGTSSVQTFTEADGTVNIVPGETMPTANFEVITWKNSAWATYTTNANTATSARMWAENVDALSPRINFYNKYFMPFRATVMDKDNNIVDWALTVLGAIDDAAEMNAAEGSQGGYYAQMHCDNKIAQSETAEAVTATLDLNGFTAATVTLHEDSVLTIVDSSAKAGEKGATLPTTQVTAGLVEHGNAKYFVKVSDTDATVYPIEYKISGVSLRPTAENASLYFSATIAAHEDVGLQNWGIAITTDGTAGDDLGNYMYTQEDKVATEGNVYNGVLIQKIAQNTNEAQKNIDNANTTIYAKAYVTLADGTVEFSTAATKKLNEVIPAVEGMSDLTEAQQNAIAAMQAADWYKDIYPAVTEE